MGLSARIDDTGDVEEHWAEGGGLRGLGAFVVATQTGFAGRLGCNGELSSCGPTFFDSGVASTSDEPEGGRLIVVCLSRFFESAVPTSPDSPVIDVLGSPPPPDTTDDTELARDPLGLLVLDPVLPGAPTRLPPAPAPPPEELAAVLEDPPDPRLC